MKSPSAAVATTAERATIDASQGSVTSRLASFGVKPLGRYLVPDVITAKLRPAQAASLSLVPGVERVLPNGIIPEGPTSATPITRVAHTGRSHVLPGVCGTAAHPQRILKR